MPGVSTRARYASLIENRYPLSSASPELRARLLAATLAIIAGGTTRQALLGAAGAAASLTWLYARSDEEQRARMVERSARMVERSARWPGFLRLRLEGIVARHAQGGSKVRRRHATAARRR
jgi:hypothetical protein